MKLKGVRAIVEERHVGDAQRRRDRGIALVPRGSDGIKALAACLQRPRQPVHLATGELRQENVGGIRPRQPGTRGIGRIGAARERSARQRAEKFFMYRLCRVHAVLLPVFRLPVQPFAAVSRS